MQKRQQTQIEASPMELAIKRLELNLKRDLTEAESISEKTDVRLIPLDQPKHYILFISDNQISHTGDNSISIRVWFDGTVLKAADYRINNELEDCVLYDAGGQKATVFGRPTEVINIDNILGEFGEVLVTFRIILVSQDNLLYLSGYNDYIDDNMQKVRFPLFSEKKFKLYASQENVEKMVEVINNQHPNIKVTWI